MVKKGAKVTVEGKLDISEYTDKEGQKRMTFGVLADTYRLLQSQRGHLKSLPLRSLFGSERLPPTRLLNTHSRRNCLLA